IGMEEFVEEPHIFQNLGDGTYQHSGLLAIRAAVSAGTSITYKVLYNDAVAMTGGQPHDGALTPEGITHQLRAEGVRRLAVVTDEPDKYGIGRAFAEGTTIHHRSELDAVQRELRSWPGVSAMVYDQTCAAEKRRRRKRGLLDDPDRRVFINELVCEGCGDCSKASNCISVEPLETEFGRKRQINQSACNKDFSCVQGFCPSFVTVSGAQVRKAPPSHDGAALSDLVARLPDPSQPDLDRPRNVVITGIGGTGVVTVGAVLGMAAHIEGKGVSVLDQVGLSQKGGAVLSEVRLAARPEDIHSVTVGRGRTDLLLGCDMVVAADAEVRGCLNPKVSAAVVNAHRAPVAQFVLDPDLSFGTRRMMELIAESSREEATDFVDATRLATTLFGDSIAGNLMLLGYAVQRGHVPVGVDALERAIELNGVAVRMNLDAFRWGRVAAGDENAIGEILGTDNLASEDHEDSLDHLIERRVQFLTAYQNRSWAERYRENVASVRTLEAARVPGEEALARATAKYLFKLMAYKDEYEVARLYTDGMFLRRIKETFTGRPSLTFHLAPPLFAPRDPATGKLRKLTFGPWMLPAFRVLARLRFLRGTPFDPFGWTRERRTERAEIRRYEGLLQTVGERLSPDNHPTAVALASLPEHIRGFGHVKEEHLARARTLETELLAAFDAKEDSQR
ncbi:MAG: indolepyruvate ferredoxin oxidoreductase family protein, partial [Rhodospirillales bacterium]|nr:indolepyruvate ferredoxin oxidoreductase family protein [Rhodospirillales bacterium]